MLIMLSSSRFFLGCPPRRPAALCCSPPLRLLGSRKDYAYNATFPEFRARAEGCGKQVLEVIQIFLNHVNQEGELGLPEVGDAGDPEVFQVCQMLGGDIL